MAAVSEPSLRNSDVLSLVARGSSRTVRSLFGGSIALRKALGRALPRGLVVSAIYDGTGGAAKVRLDLADVAALQRLRDAVLDGSIDEKLRAEERVVVDRGAFAQRLATSLLRFEELTAHQRRALVQTRGARAVLLTAPAGGGKTFVAIARAVEALEHEAEALAVDVAGEVRAQADVYFKDAERPVAALLVVEVADAREAREHLRHDGQVRVGHRAVALAPIKACR